VFILLPIDQNGHPTTWGELSLDMELAPSPHHGRTSTFVASPVMIWPGVHSRLCHAVSVHFNDIHFHTRWFAYPLYVALIVWLDLVRGRGVHVGVDTPLCS